MKHTKLISGIVGIVLGVIIAFFIPAPAGLSHAGMVVLASLVTANIFWIFNVIPSFVTGLLPKIIKLGANIHIKLPIVNIRNPLVKSFLIFKKSDKRP